MKSGELTSWRARAANPHKYVTFSRRSRGNPQSFFTPARGKQFLREYLRILEGNFVTVKTGLSMLRASRGGRSKPAVNNL
jgi:hypothetical protein